MANCARGLLVEIVTAAGAVALLAGGASGAAAQTRDRDLAACTKIAEPDRRLACYDAVMRAKARSGELPPAPAAEAPESRAPAGDAFGLPPAVPRPEPAPAARGSAHTADDFGLPRVREAEKKRVELLSAVRRVVSPIPGRWYVELENGQLWRVLGEDYRPLPAGSEVRIREGLLGSFSMEVAGRRYKVRRVR